MLLEGVPQLVDVDLARVDVVSQGIFVQRKSESLKRRLNFDVKTKHLTFLS